MDNTYYASNDFRNYRDLYLEHYGIKGMKWGKHKRKSKYDKIKAYRNAMYDYYTNVGYTTSSTVDKLHRNIGRGDDVAFDLNVNNYNNRLQAQRYMQPGKYSHDNTDEIYKEMKEKQKNINKQLRDQKIDKAKKKVAQALEDLKKKFSK